MYNVYYDDNWTWTVSIPYVNTKIKNNKEKKKVMKDER